METQRQKKKKLIIGTLIIALVIFAIVCVLINLITVFNSWLKIHPYIFVAKWGNEETDNGEVFSPSRIVIDSKGYFYVLDTKNCQIQKFDSTGRFLMEWGSKGNNDGQFEMPCDITVDRENYLYVTDGCSNYIQKFSSFGKFIKKWSIIEWNKTSLKFTSFPYHCAVDGEGNILVTGCPTNICKFTPDGDYIERQFVEDYTHIAVIYGLKIIGNIHVDSSGNILVVYLHRPGKEHIFKFKSLDQGPRIWSIKDSKGKSAFTRDIATDVEGNVYITDADNHCVKKFDSHGNFITQWGSRGSGNGDFYKPAGIAVDSEGYIYVADTGNHRIQKFKPNPVQNYIFKEER